MGQWDELITGSVRQNRSLSAAVELGHVLPFRLGILMVEPALKRVSSDDGREEFIEPKVMKVLVALARVDGALVTRDDLMRCCWTGVTVGDDALSRVLTLLRRLAEGIGKHSFRVETVPHVGCRIVTSARDARDDEAPPPTVPVPQPAVSGVEQVSWRKRLLARPMPIALGAMLLAICGLAAWWTYRPVPSQGFTLRVLPPVLNDSAIPSFLPDAIRDRVGAAFEADKVVSVVANNADFVLGGAVTREGERLHFDMKLADRDGTDVQSWSQVTSPDPQRSATQVSVRAASLLRCALIPLAAHRQPLARHLRSLFFQLCAGGVATRRLDIARTLVREAPDFAGGWAQLAYAYGSAAFAGPARAAPGQRTHSREAALRALALDPQSSSAYRVLAWAQAPGTPYRDIEAILNRAVSNTPPSCSCIYRDRGDFLLDVGRIYDAIGEYQRAVDIEPGASETLSLAHAWYFAGNPQRAVELTVGVKTGWGDKDWFPFVAIDDALAARDWATAGKLIARDATTDDERAIAAAFAAIAAGDHARLSALLPAIERMASVPALDMWKVRPPMIDERPALLLTLSGQHQKALDAIGGLLARYGPDGGQLLFNPVAASLRREPGYIRLLERSGFMRYWRETGTSPDFCSASDAPSFCKGLG